MAIYHLWIFEEIQVGYHLYDPYAIVWLQNIYKKVHILEYYSSY